MSQICVAPPAWVDLWPGPEVIKLQPWAKPSGVRSLAFISSQQTSPKNKLSGGLLENDQGGKHGNPGGKAEHQRYMQAKGKWTLKPTADSGVYNVCEDRALWGQSGGGDRAGVGTEKGRGQRAGDRAGEGQSRKGNRAGLRTEQSRGQSRRGDRAGVGTAKSLGQGRQGGRAGVGTCLGTSDSRAAGQVTCEQAPGWLCLEDTCSCCLVPLASGSAL